MSDLISELEQIEMGAVGGQEPRDGSLSPDSDSTVPSLSDDQPACVCRLCAGLPHGPDCFITRGGVRQLVESTLGVFSAWTGARPSTRAALAALGVTTLGAAAGALTYYSLTTATSDEESVDTGLLREAAAQVSLSELPTVQALPDSVGTRSSSQSSDRPWFNQYD